jgi:hypothetical protein
MDEFILDPPDDEDYRRNRHINSHDSLHPSSKSLIIDRHLDKALENANMRLFEEAIELWKIYGES